MARPDIIRVLQYARKQGFQIIIYSNGSFFDKKIVKKLADISPNKVDITLPGMSPAVFESITGISGSHGAVFKGINLLKRHKINLGFKTCLLKENAGEIPAIKAFCRSLGATHRLDTLLCGCLDGSTQPYKCRGKLSGVAKKKNSPGKEKAGKEVCLGNTSESYSWFSCGAGQSQAAITPAGELKICPLIDYPKYDLRVIPLEKAWRKTQIIMSNIVLAKPRRCLTCGLQLYCVSCPARSWLYNKTFFSCDPRARAWARRQKEEYEN